MKRNLCAQNNFCPFQLGHSFYFIFYNFYMFAYLFGPTGSLLWHAAVLAVLCELIVAACEI